MSEESGLTFSEASEVLNRLVEEASRVIKGKREFLEYLVTAAASGGHVLVEDMPGLGKTTAAKTLASLIDTSESDFPGFSRIQFTPDLLPYDITGVDVFHPESGSFNFAHGPVFTSILLADEINRTTPKVQSALLEVMAEHQVTVGGKTHSLGEFFFVMATQNPVEIEGTYTLPAAQLDRFLMRLSIGYPDAESEFLIVTEDPSVKTIPSLSPVCTGKTITAVQNTAGEIYCHPELIKAVISAVSQTRAKKEIELGASPRGSLMLIKSAKALALLRGRDHVVDQDIIDLAVPVLAHRIVMKKRESGSREMIRELIIGSLDKINY